MEQWIAQTSWEQIRLWHQYAQVEPFGEERADLRAGIIASAIVNILIAVNTDRRKGRARMTKPSDFMPSFGGELAAGRAPVDVTPTTGEQWARFKAGLNAGLREQQRRANR